jgi:REP element-mobilizing transposase RayT
MYPVWTRGAGRLTVSVRGPCEDSCRIQMAAPRQTSLALRPRFGHGGARPGAGRPRQKDHGVSHSARPRLGRHHPAHVTLRALPGSPNLRKGAAWRAVESALAAIASRDACRVVHFSVQSNHVHLLVEAEDRLALSRGVQGLAIRIARRVNRACARSGRLWGNRYHARILRTPREVRNCLCYVLQNAWRHADLARGIFAPGWIDPHSSGAWFDGWSDVARGADATRVRLVAAARTWLLRTGWRRRGLVGVDEVPRSAWG